MSNLNLTNVSHKTSKSVIVETIEAFVPSREDIGKVISHLKTSVVSEPVDQQ
jgi:hypothetical protein